MGRGEGRQVKTFGAVPLLDGPVALVGAETKTYQNRPCGSSQKESLLVGVAGSGLREVV